VPRPTFAERRADRGASFSSRVKIFAAALSMDSTFFNPDINILQI
jgi:hypothetical protein